MSRMRRRLPQRRSLALLGWIGVAGEAGMMPLLLSLVNLTAPAVACFMSLRTWVIKALNASESISGEDGWVAGIRSTRFLVFFGLKAFVIVSLLEAVVKGLFVEATQMLVTLLVLRKIKETERC